MEKSKEVALRAIGVDGKRIWAWCGQKDLLDSCCTKNKWKLYGKILYRVQRRVGDVDMEEDLFS